MLRKTGFEQFNLRKGEVGEVTLGQLRNIKHGLTELRGRVTEFNDTKVRDVEVPEMVLEKSESYQQRYLDDMATQCNWEERWLLMAEMQESGSDSASNHS